MTEQPLMHDVRRHLAMFHKRRGILGICLSAALLNAVLYNYTARPLYQATVQILIEHERPKVLPTEALVDPGMQGLETEYEMIRGRALAERLVERLQLQKSPELQTGPLMSPWARVQQKILGRTPAPPVDTQGIPLSPAAAAVRSRISVEPLPSRQLVNLRFRAYDPKLASEAANALAELYIEQRQELRYATSSEATGWLADRVRDQKKKLEEAEQALIAYQEKQGLTDISEREGAASEKVTALATAVLAARMERITKETALAQMRGLGPGQLSSFPQVAQSTGVQSARARVVELQSEQSRLAETLGERHPDMQRLRGEVAQAEDKLQAEVRGVLRALESELAGARAREASLESNVEQAKQESLAVSRKGTELSALRREVESHKQMFQSLINRNKETGLESQLTATNVRIVERAETPGGPFSPNRRRNYQVALLVGLVLGIGLTLLFENFDNTVRTPEDVKELGLPFLGMVPAVEVPPVPKGSFSRPTFKPAEGPVAEAYRVVRTNLLFSSTAEGGRALLVASTNPGEGKTTTAANLALSLAANGARVLVVDADLRRPTLHQHFSITKTPGLTDVIVGKVAVSEAIQTTRNSGLSILPCGYLPPNPAELLGSSVMRELLKAFRTRFDWVLIDTPPVLAMADTPVLCPFVDGVILVVASEASSRPALHRAVDQLRSVGGTIIGIVLNKVDLQRNSYYYSQYYGEYYRSYYADAEPRAAAAGPRPFRKPGRG